MRRNELRTESARRSIERRREEAARWFVTLQDAELSEHVLRSWKKWESIPENREAFDAVERIWERADGVPELPIASADERADDDYDGSVPIASWRANFAADPAPSPRRHVLGRTFGLAAAAAGFLIIVALAIPSLQTLIHFFAGTPDRTVVVETGLGEHKQLVFEDGTRIQLGARSSVTANFTRRARSVVLDDGVASFNVAHDPKRPFQVSAGAGTITAIGTAFNVQRRQDNDVTVSVTEGVVEVAAASSAFIGDTANAKERPVGLRVTRGQEVTYDGEGKWGPIRLADMTSNLAWRNGYFRYSREPLTHVIEDINRYSRLQLVLEDPAVGRLLYSGTVFTPDITEWLAGLEKTYPEIEVRSTVDSHALIRARAPADPSSR